MCFFLAYNRLSVRACFCFVSYLFSLCPFTTGMHAQNSLKFHVFLSMFEELETNKKEEYLFVSQRSERETLFEVIWKNEWGGDMFFSHGTNHSKGV